jgi:Na+-driven multidrug efflux pump
MARARKAITDDEVRQVRKQLWWALPASLAFSALMTTHFFAGRNAIQDLLNDEPMVSIWPMSILAIPAAVMMIVASVTGIVRAIPVERAIATAQRISLWSGFLCIAVIVFALLFARPLQNYVMPKYGYQVCERTEVGATRLWFTDWVKNPKWCVPGKNLDWVREQAAKEAAAAKESAKP